LQIAQLQQENLKLQKQAGDAAKSAHYAAADATIAKDAAASAIHDLAILQSLVSGREIFDTTPIKELRLKGKLVHVMSGDLEEAKSFCKSISDDLHGIAGMDTKPSCQSAYPNSETGVSGPSLPESRALAKALTEATHFSFKVIRPDPMSSRIADDLKVLIGPKPSFTIKPTTKKQDNIRP
jgi:hypothetical protein